MYNNVMKDHLTIKEAAEIFGVTPQTIRNWDNKGKLKAFRHPMNNYRLYDRSELEKIAKKIREL